MIKSQGLLTFRARAILILHEEKKELEEMGLHNSLAHTNRIHWISTLPHCSNTEVLRILTEAKGDLVA